MKTWIKSTTVCTLLGISMALVSTEAHAQSNLTFEVTQPSAANSDPNADNLYFGATTNSGTSYTAKLNPLSPQYFQGPSSISFGTITQSALYGAIGSGTYHDVAANFTYDISIPIMGATRQFAIQGLINGTTSYDGQIGATNALFSVKTIKIDGIVQNLIAVTSPAGRLSYEVSGIDFGNGHTANVYIDQSDALSAPGATAPLTIGGYVTPVPEPSTFALLMGIGVMGTGISLVNRRRSRARIAMQTTGMLSK